MRTESPGPSPYILHTNKVVDKGNSKTNHITSLSDIFSLGSFPFSIFPAIQFHSATLRFPGRARLRSWAEGEVKYQVANQPAPPILGGAL